MTSFVKLYSDGREISIDIHSIVGVAHMHQCSYKEGLFFTKEVKYHKYSILLLNGQVEHLIGYEEDEDNYQSYIEGYKRLEDFLND